MMHMQRDAYGMLIYLRIAITTAIRTQGSTWDRLKQRLAMCGYGRYVCPQTHVEPMSDLSHWMRRRN
jgi:hypothetical protein